MDKIIKAVPLDNYRIDILTSSGIAGVFDVRPYLKGLAFRELENPSYFKQVRTRADASNFLILSKLVPESC
jgi:hypothetical protein